MALGGVAELLFGVPAEQRPLEQVAKPITAEEAEGGGAVVEGRRAPPERRGRVRFGPGRFSYSPFPLYPSDIATIADFDREVQAIATALEEHGAVDRRELALIVDARGWGPGRFRAALREAVRTGAARPLSRSSFGPKEGSTTR
jgi:hypothetical protein